MVEAVLNSQATANAAALETELDWLAAVMRARLDPVAASDPRWPPAPDLPESLYASFVNHYELDAPERLVVALALAPHVQPQLLDAFYRANDSLKRGHTEYGGIHGRMHGGFLPTGETALFLLAGADLEQRFACQALFGSDHYFASHHILTVEAAPAGEPTMSGQLLLSDQMIDFLTVGGIRKPSYSSSFPAKLIATELEWDDLVVSSTTLGQIEELEAWVRHEATLMREWGLAHRLRPGYRCLFHGPPGTGKTLMATLLGKKVDLDVYRVSLSAVISKYIGETEKNLENIFQRAERQRCILFFDEADALFGKRTSVGDAHDRYANQEVSYLLQRIEDYAGIVVLASNYGSNMDDAFKRRFQAVVHFPMPDTRERTRLWTRSFASCSTLAADVQIDEIARRYELSGGSIMNVVRYASLMALDRDSRIINRSDLINGIRRELRKDGKTL